MQMPAMDGVTLAAQIRKLPQAAALPLVLLTSMGVRSDHPGFRPRCLCRLPDQADQTGPAPRGPAPRHVRLQTRRPARPRPPPNSIPTLATRLPLRVLLCDDNTINQKVALRLLQQMGYRADLAANGVEALAALDRQPYDLIFMDVMMPEMGGLEATRLIRQRQREPCRFPHYKSPLIIIAMTASAMQGDREKCLAAGMDDYIAKPVRLEDVRAIIERWAATAARSLPAQPPAATAETPPKPAASTDTAAPPSPSPLPRPGGNGPLARTDRRSSRQFARTHHALSGPDRRATAPNPGRRPSRTNRPKCAAWPTVAPAPVPPAACAGWSPCSANLNTKAPKATWKAPPNSATRSTPNSPASDISWKPTSPHTPG